LEYIIDIIDKLEEILGIEGIFISHSLLKENLSKYLSSILIEKFYYCFIEKTYDSEEALKFEIYTIIILLSKGSFEAKVNSKQI
jgi:hypothetical protein